MMKKTLTKQKIEEIRKDPNDQYWFYISSQYELSESFIREFKDEVWWGNISQFQTLSESFIEEFKDEVVWSSISWCQTLSEDFICEFIDRVNIDYILKYQPYLSIETRNKIKVIYELSK